MCGIGVVSVRSRGEYAAESEEASDPTQPAHTAPAAAVLGQFGTSLSKQQQTQYLFKWLKQKKV